MFGLGNSAVHRLHKTWEVRGAAVEQQLRTFTMPPVVSLFILLCAENPQQDQEDLLRLREADGEGPRSGSTSGCILPRLHAMLSLCLRPLQDPSRNHRAYRLAVAKLSPPYIPFMPLLLKGETLQPPGEHPRGCLLMC